MVSEFEVSMLFSLLSLPERVGERIANVDVESHRWEENVTILVVNEIISTGIHCKLYLSRRKVWHGPPSK